MELEKSHSHALLVSRKTSFSSDWDCGRYLCLLDGPSLYQRVYLPAGLEAGSALEGRRAEHQSWLVSFGQLAQEARLGQSTAIQEQCLTRNLLEHLDWEESEVYPRLDRFLGNSRLTRDLGYEHLGIRRLLPKLSEALACLRPDSRLTEAEKRRSWERFSLELIHLVEHHIEHEERGAYPLYELLTTQGDSLTQLA